jgi:hypothetical protein
VGGNMQVMFCDLFGVHDVREDSYEPQLGAQGGEEQIMDDEPDIGDVQKYDDLLKKADKPLHGKTKHSKLSATVHLYNLKCLGGVTNTIFLAFLEFVNQLLPNDGETLPDNTYQAKKFLRDMGLGYEKIPAYRNDCMLFWKDNKDLDSCFKCEQSKWKDEVHLDEDGQPISSIIALVSINSKIAEVVHVTMYCAQYEMACRGLHKRRRIEASGRWQSMKVIR